MADIEELTRIAVGRVITNANNWPRPISVHVLGRDLSEQIDKLVDALLPVIREREAEVWDAGYTVGNAHNGRRDANPYRSNGE